MADIHPTAIVDPAAEDPCPGREHHRLSREVNHAVRVQDIRLHGDRNVVQAVLKIHVAVIGQPPVRNVFDLLGGQNLAVAVRLTRDQYGRECQPFGCVLFDDGAGQFDAGLIGLLLFVFIRLHNLPFRFGLSHIGVDLSSLIFG